MNRKQQAGQHLTATLVERIENLDIRNLFAQTAVEIWDLEVATLTDVPNASRCALAALGEME